MLFKKAPSSKTYAEGAGVGSIHPAHDSDGSGNAQVLSDLLYTQHGKFLIPAGMAGAPILTEKERKELEKKRAKAEKEKEKEIIKAEKERAKLLKQAAAEREKEEKRRLKEQKKEEERLKKELKKAQKLGAKVPVQSAPAALAGDPAHDLLAAPPTHPHARSLALSQNANAGYLSPSDSLSRSYDLSRRPSEGSAVSSCPNCHGHRQSTGAPSASSSIVAGKVRPTLSHQISADSPHYSDGCCDSPRSAGRPGTSSCSRRGDDRDRDRDRESRDGHRDRDRDSRDGRESLREERGSLREERGSLRDERASLPDRDRGERGERGERRASSRLSDRVDPGPTSTTTASSVPSISDRERDLLASERERLERERELLVREKELLREKEKMLKEKEKQEKKQTSRGRSPSGERPGERSGDRDSGSRRSSQRHSSESKRELNRRMSYESDPEGRTRSSSARGYRSGQHTEDSDDVNYPDEYDSRPRRGSIEYDAAPRRSNGGSSGYARDRGSDRGDRVYDDLPIRGDRDYDDFPASRYPDDGYYSDRTQITRSASSRRMAAEDRERRLAADDYMASPRTSSRDSGRRELREPPSGRRSRSGSTYSLREPDIRERDILDPRDRDYYDDRDRDRYEYDRRERERELRERERDRGVSRAMYDDYGTRVSRSPSLPPAAASTRMYERDRERERERRDSRVHRSSNLAPPSSQRKRSGY